MPKILKFDIIAIYEFLKHPQKGFTLIEFMVVISIISLLSSVVLAAVSDAKKKAETTKFRSEVVQLINALELYKIDNGNYPGEESLIVEDEIFWSTFWFNGVLDENDAVNVKSEIVPKYIAKMPQLPRSSQDSYFYYFRDNNSRCLGDTTIPPYVLLILGNDDLVKDWPTMYGQPDYRCFSLK